MVRSKYREYEIPLSADAGEKIQIPVPSDTSDPLRLQPLDAKPVHPAVNSETSTTKQNSDSGGFDSLAEDDDRHGESSSRPLPLPDQDRLQIEQTIQWRRLRRYSMRDILTLTTFLAVGLAASTWFPAQVYAAVLGLFAAIAVGYLVLFPSESRLVHIGFVTLLTVYIGAAIAALVEYIRE